MDTVYKGEYLHDLATHKEFNRSYADSNLLLNLSKLFWCGFVIWLMHHFTQSGFIRYFLYIALFFLVGTILENSKKGDFQYRRILQANHGYPRHHVVTFTDECVHIVATTSGNKLDYAYDQFRYGIESQNLLIFVLKYRSCVILHKDTLEGGTIPELFDFIKSRCPKFKGKHPRKTHWGRWVRKILATVLILGSIWALLNLPVFSVMDRIWGRLDNSITYEQMADVLDELDIHISQRAIDEMQQYDADYFAENNKNYYAGAARYQKISDLLYWEGCGFYNDMKGQWQASTSGVFWQDHYSEQTQNVFPDFLNGLSAIDKSLQFSDVQVALDQSAITSGSGSAKITFQWKEQTYELEADYTANWFDADIISQIGKIVNTEEEKLYVCNDDTSGVLLYYGTADQIRQLERYTAMNFQDASRKIR